MASLSRLQRGEGWVWAPDPGILARETFPAIATFDSMRAPEHGDAIPAPPSALAAVEMWSAPFLICARMALTQPLTAPRRWPGSPPISATGVLYGVTSKGGDISGCSCGTVFALTPPAGDRQPWHERILHRFGRRGDGASPEGRMITDKAGNLYGTERG